MDVLIKDVTIIHKGSEFHLKTFDIQIRDGIIIKIENNIFSQDVEIVSGSKLICCVGLCDIGTQSGEPGYEHRETIYSLTRAALSGGYTALAIFPETRPIIQTKGDIQYLINHTSRNGVKLFPIGALSKDNIGKDIGEYMDMKHAGAVAFSQGISSVRNTGLLGRSLQYASVTGLSVLHHPDDHFLSEGGEMHEGDTSTMMGLKGIPSISEIHTLQRDILLVEYNGGKLIEHAISTEESIEIIRTAKNKGINVFSTVPYLNLIFSDEDLVDFDTNLKVKPPIRSQKDRETLIAGLKDSTIDAIISNHTPLDEESKNLEFPYATPGASGIETCLAACITYLENDLELEIILEKLTVGPRKLLNITIPEIRIGVKADICVIDTGEAWTFEKENSLSKSLNNPFIGKTFKGKVIYTSV